MKSFEYLLLAFPLILHLLIDATGKVNHKLNGWLMLLSAFLIGFFTQGYFWQGTFYALCIHMAFFDWIYNIVHNHPFFYHGTKSNPNRALTDQLWAVTPPHAEIFLKLFILSIGVSVYHYLPNIIGYIP